MGKGMPVVAPVRRVAEEGGNRKLTCGWRDTFSGEASEEKVLPSKPELQYPVKSSRDSS